ncbi:hypothetical protein HNR56_003989 [Roseospira marina]|nr:hypothetical protein [Roseospira marina]MBB5089272.1 hypothetical protein [Roseospira marina]
MASNIPEVTQTERLGVPRPQRCLVRHHAVELAGHRHPAHGRVEGGSAGPRQPGNRAAARRRHGHGDQGQPFQNLHKIQT